MWPSTAAGAHPWRTASGQVVRMVEHRTFSGPEAARRGSGGDLHHRALRLPAEAGWPATSRDRTGVDLQKDILDQMAFRPIIDGQPALMDARAFPRRADGHRPELLDKPLAERFGYDPGAEPVFPRLLPALPCAAPRYPARQAAVDAALGPDWPQVKAIVNYDRFGILPELIVTTSPWSRRRRAPLP